MKAAEFMKLRNVNQQITRYVVYFSHWGQFYRTVNFYVNRKEDSRSQGAHLGHLSAAAVGGGRALSFHQQHLSRLLLA